MEQSALASAAPMLRRLLLVPGVLRTGFFDARALESSDVMGIQLTSLRCDS
jgi:hypothetical protein